MFAVVAGIALSKFGKYKPLHAGAFALTSVAFGLFTLLRANTSKVTYVWFELIASMGMGPLLSVILPAIMAPLPEEYVATASATYSFIRTFGYVWGVTIASLIFNSVFERNLHSISNQEMQQQLRGGAAYSFASQIHSIDDDYAAVVREEIIAVYVKSLRAVWWTCLGISVFSFGAVALERSVELRKELDTEYGLEKGDKKQNEMNGEGQQLRTPGFVEASGEKGVP